MLWCARPGWWLGLVLGVASPVVAQQRGSPPTPEVQLGDNFPNPFFPATTIPFVLPGSVCADGHQPTVTLEIYNVLVQVVAVPVLRRSDPVPLRELKLDCGDYQAFWDGRYADGVREVTPGVYYYRLTVDGRSLVKKMLARRGPPADA